jgi:hypothetical protein
MKREEIIEEMAPRFWAKVARSIEEQCWEWTGGRNHRGYGNFRADGRTVRAHRFAWEQVNGSIPAGLMICHRCDNPSCCNPAHLFVGTAKDNVRDMIAKGRDVRPPHGGANHCRGSASHLAKLTEEQVIQIRRRYQAGERPRFLSAEFGVGTQMIWNIGTGRWWKHV